MTYEYLFDTYPAQDGAIFGDTLFRFNERGDARVYSVSAGRELARFTLDRVDYRMPHSNAVSFGPDKYAPDDEFPLLYTNIYNTYSAKEERHEGELCVYRIFRTEEGFSSTLLGVIRIGFVEDRRLWKSLDGNADVRAFGNFAVDCANNRLYAFVMRDREHITRYFTFALPRLSDGELIDGVSHITLTEADILDTFDERYMNYMQGACAKDSIVYSVEGFGMQGVNLPRMQVIDMAMHKVIHDIPLGDLGLEIEPEFVDFASVQTFPCLGEGGAQRATDEGGNAVLRTQNILFYSDATGKIYAVKL